MSWHTTNPGDLAGSWSARPGRGSGASGQGTTLDDRDVQGSRELL
jgi:hypothetical protein